MVERRPVPPTPIPTSSHTHFISTPPIPPAQPLSSLQPPPVSQTQQQQSQTGSTPANLAEPTRLGGWIDRAKSALDLFAIFWFVVGNYMLYTSTTCAETAQPIYYLSLTVIVYGYLIITVPLLLCTAVIFCLPCVLVGMRVLHVNEGVDMGGASSEEIASIPVFQFKSNKSTTTAPAPLVQLSNSQNIKTTPIKPGLLDRLWIRLGLMEFPSDPTLPEPEYEVLEIPQEQYQVCAICLSDYEDGDILCQLWCQHHFHKTCVSEWLALNSRCPMCKRDCRGKQSGVLTEA
ncbi:hypothetical protein EC973_004729 [Apophysomyces ossiformis]|uniref:RING-type domain-containing protein n=1 Tax=Apophysomyces ossiformis TaxID=679940 RepID=A0A8H7BJV1_9FUNG|nr:hypothetical protein EC973_004729 [Apophysomyces ossiformis]